MAAVAAQYTLPVPSLVQLGSELTTPAKTCPVETGAQDGLPIPVALPVEMKPPQVADAAGAISGQADTDSRQVAIFFIVSSLRWLGLRRWLRMGAETKIRRKYTT